MKSDKNKFEDNMASLEQIVKELENDDLTLDEAVKKFEDGMKLSKECSKELESAEKKITVLLQENDDFKEEEFNK